MIKVSALALLLVPAVMTIEPVNAREGTLNSSERREHPCKKAGTCTSGGVKPQPAPKLPVPQACQAGLRCSAK